MNIAIIVGLFVVIGVPGCIGLTPVEFAIKCIEEYKTVLKNYNSEEGTCTRWQILINCLGKRREMQGQMVDAMRYFVTQNGIFLSKLSVCPDIDFKDLKEITDKTAFAKQHKYLDKIGKDKPDQCAVDVYMKCTKKYLAIFTSNHKLCDNVDGGINCVTEEKKASGCDADILKHYEQMMRRIGFLMVRAVRQFAGIECKSDTIEDALGSGSYYY